MPLRSPPSPEQHQRHPTRDVQPVWEATHKRWTIRGLQTGDEAVVPSAFGHTIKILDCIGGRVIVSGKCKIALVDSCRDMEVQLLGGVVIQLEVVNATRTVFHVARAVPTLQIDKAADVTVRFTTPGAAVGSQIVAAQFEALSVQHPVAGSGGAVTYAQEFVELPAGARNSAQVRSVYAQPPRRVNDDDSNVEEIVPSLAPRLVTELFALYDRDDVRLGAAL